MDWYYTLNEQQQGPVSQEQLGSLLQQGTLNADSMVWREGMADWQPLSAALPELLGGAAAGAEANKDLNVQAMREGVMGDLSGPQLQYAGFWIRFAAWFLDAIILTIVMIPVQLVFFAAVGASAADPEAMASGGAIGAILIYYLIALAVPILYRGIMVGKYSATLGKMACGLKVVRPDGSPVSTGLAFGRALAELISQIIIYIGYIMAAFDDEKRSLHDRICSSRVIKKNG